MAGARHRRVPAADCRALDGERGVLGRISTCAEPAKFCLPGAEGARRNHAGDERSTAGTAEEHFRACDGRTWHAGVRWAVSVLACSSVTELRVV